MKTYRAITAGRTERQYFRDEDSTIVRVIALDNNGHGYVHCSEIELSICEKECKKVGDTLNWAETDTALAHDFYFMMTQFESYQHYCISLQEKLDAKA